MVAVEAGLKKLATYLDDNKQWSKSQDTRFRGVEERLDRLSGLVAQSHAALSATANGLELVAKATGPALAEKTADIVAGKLEPRLSKLDQKQAIVELGGELARLSAQSKHFARSSDERLKQLQSSLDESLDRMDEYAQAGEAQPASSRWDGEGKDSAVEDDYDGKMIAAARKAARLADGPAQDYPGEGEPLRYQIPYGEFLPEDERSNSRAGLVVAAVILLLASVAMLYLNLRDSGAEGKLSSAWLSLSAPKKDDSKLHTGSIEAVPVKTQIIRPDAPSGSEQDRLPQNPLLASVATPEPEAGDAATDRLPVNKSGKTASLRTAAVAGDAEAQFSVGEIYLDGRDLDSSVPVEERLSKAARWFRRAAEKGHAPSQYRLATLYELGQGAPKDHARAMGWYSRAAESGHVKAMHNLAVLSVVTDSAPRDYAAAANWFEKAAAHGLRDSQYNLGLLYERGLGVEKDAAKAYRWFSLAAKAGDTNARSKQTGLAEALSRQEKEQADRETTSWRAVNMDMATNSEAPEPPVRKSRDAEAITEAKHARPQLMKSSWAPQIASLDEAVIKAQRLLVELGYNPGPVDGILGPRTMAAIRAFETKSGLPGTGKPTDALIARLSGSVSI
jgi:TPR repeat protein